MAWGPLRRTHETVAIVVIVLVVLLVIVLAVLAGRRNKRRAVLRERFGPEYDLAVKRGKDRRAVEQRLEQLDGHALLVSPCGDVLPRRCR